MDHTEPPSSQCMNPCPDALKQLDELLADLDEHAYRHECDLLPGGSVGGHVRHCIEFYQCLAEGLGSGEVDYDSRRRDPDIESSPRAARKALRKILEVDLPAIETLSPQMPLRVRESLSTWQSSSLGREWGFAFSHTIHHLALIGVLLRDHGSQVSAEIGVAPSTARHLAAQQRG